MSAYSAAGSTSRRRASENVGLAPGAAAQASRLLGAAEKAAGGGEQHAAEVGLQAEADALARHFRRLLEPAHEEECAGLVVQCDGRALRVAERAQAERARALLESTLGDGAVVLHDIE